MLLALFLSVLVGVALGLLGGGGSILTLPILLYAVGMEEKPAIATSLLVVAATSAAALVAHARAGNVEWRTGGIFAGAGAVGAFLGGWLADFVPGAWLLWGFLAMMVATGIAMIRGRKSLESVTPPRLPLGRILLDGLVVGLVTGLVGAGGGFLVVPALALLGGLPMPKAVGTSLLVIAIKSSFGFAGHALHVPVDYGLATAVSGAAVAGSLVGGALTRRVPAGALRQGFGLFVLGMAAFMGYQQIA